METRAARNQDKPRSEGMLRLRVGEGEIRFTEENRATAEVTAQLLPGGCFSIEERVHRIRGDLT